jgi:hypothetical protein
MGRFPIVKSATLVFCAIAADQPPLMLANTNTRTYTTNVNPLYPFPTLITNSAVRLTNWEAPVSASIRGNNSTATTLLIMPTNSSPTNAWQYPSYNPTNFIGTAIITAINTASNATGWTKVIVDTNASYLWGNPSSNARAGLTNAGGLTITHPGLLYGGDLNTNTGAFDLYNLYFYYGGVNGNSVWNLLHNSNAAGAVGNSFDFATSYTNASGKKIWTNNGSNAVTTVQVPATNDPLFPLPYETVMQPVLILDLAIVNPGFSILHPNFKVRVKGLGSLRANNQALFGNGDYGQLITGFYGNGGGCGFGPDFGVPTTFYTNNMNSNWVNGSSAPNGTFPFLGNFVKTSAGTNFGRTFPFSSSSGTGTITVEFLKPTASWSTSDSTDIIQSVTMSFPPTEFPTPKLPAFNGVDTSLSRPIYAFGTNDLTVNVRKQSWPAKTPINFILPQYLFPSNNIATINRFSDIGSGSSAGPFNMGMLFLPETYPVSTNVLNNTNFGYTTWSTANTFRSVEVAYGDWRIPAMMQTIRGPSQVPTIISTGLPSVNSFTINDPTALYAPHRLYYAYKPSFALLGGNAGFGTNFYWRAAHTLRGQLDYYAYGDSGNKFLTPSMFLAGLNDGYYKGLSNANYPGMIYSPVRTASDNPERLMGYRLSHDGWGNYPEALSTVDLKGEITAVPASAIFTNVWQKGGDFDNGTGVIQPDGPYINKSDEGSVGFTTGSSFGNFTAYNGFTPLWATMGRTRFSPNKQVPSAGIFGSLPVGFDPSAPSITNAWQTLLFCPNPNGTNHVSLNKMPPDYMIMDLFEMPIVQPYPISAPLSTAGRVNLNYQIAPFNYIKRDSALRGVLKSVQISAVRDDDGPNYKYMRNGTADNRTISPSTNFNPATNNYSYRFPVHLDNTLKQFDDKFATNGFFRSGAEICSVWLYPAVAPAKDKPLNPSIAYENVNYDTANTSISNWWYSKPGISRKGMTGNNSREKPYMAIYPNITTKSNTYQIHYRVQTLKQTPFAHPSDWAKWVEPGSGSGASDKITGDLRGSAIIERYIDATDEKIPDFAGNIASGGNNAINSLTNSLDPYYRYRVINSRFFTP